MKSCAEKKTYNPHAGITGDIDKMMNGESVDTEKGKVKECEKSLWDKFCDYMDKTWDMLIKGNAAEDVTLLGFLAELVVAGFGFDFVLDIRDIIADIYLTVIGEQSFCSVIVDCMWLIPIVGIFKYSDELCALCKKIKCPDWIKKIKKWSGKIDDWEWVKKLKKMVRER